MLTTIDMFLHIIYECSPVSGALRNDILFEKTTLNIVAFTSVN